VLVVKAVFRNAAINAAVTTAYVIVVATFLYYAPGVLGQARRVLVPIAMLLLFVFSAAFTGAMVLGRPLLWYLEGRKSEAVALVIATLAMLFAMTIVALLAQLLAMGR
jgi:hypothetical protein